MPVQVARSARLNYPLTTYVGDRGQIFWDEAQGEIRLSNGITPGGISLNGNIGELDPLFIPNLPGINPVVQADDLFLLYDASTGALKKVTFQQLSVSGETGYTGSRGEVGYTGSQGETGYVGSRGDVGYVGSQGEVGYTGSKGLQGLRGYSGSQGEVGYTGSAGVDGYTGSQGEVGYTGSAGVDGYTGSQGEVGYTGSAGVDGYTGSQGEVGYTGSQGEVGYTGSQGEVGYTGSQGEVGYTGSRGLGFIDANVSQQGELILVYEDSSSVNAGSVVGYTGSSGADGAAGIASVENNSGLLLTDDVLSTTYNTAISDTVESVSVGGASSAPASTWKNKNIVQVLDTILFPDIAPTYTIPTLSASGTQSGTKEIGQTITQNITLTATENDAGIFSELIIKRGGTVLGNIDDPIGSTITAVADQYGYANPNTPNLRYTFSYIDNFTVTPGASSWSGTGDYEAGLAKQNNKGVVDSRTPAVRSASAPQAASTINSNSISVTGIYPYFWGVSSTLPTPSSIAAAIAAGTTNKVLSSSTGTVSITFNASAEYIWFAHYASYTTKTKWYNTELNQGAIGAGNFILSPISQGVDSPDGYWNDVLFSIYISDAATATEGAIQFRNS